jgi:ribonuclease HI
MTLFPHSPIPAGSAPAPGTTPAKPRWEDRGKGKALTLHFDGGSRGNPGPAGIGVTLADDDGTPLYELGEFLGRCTNNVAEYTALLRGLHAAHALRAAKLAVHSDSELLVRQINGIYKVKSPDLKPLFQKAVALINAIGDVTVSHIYREGNTRADELANLAMDTLKKHEPLGPLPQQ